MFLSGHICTDNDRISMHHQDIYIQIIMDTAMSVLARYV